MMNKWRIGYAAGILDGEGSITIVKRASPTSKGGYRYQLMVSLSNLSEVLCEWMRDNFNGSSFRSGITKGGNPIWHWCLRGASAGRFLYTVYPYIIIKKEKANVGLAFQSRRHRGKWGRMGRPDAEWELDRQQKQQIEATK